MSLTSQAVNGSMAEVLRQNAIAVLLSISFDIHVSYATSAMAEHMSTLRERDPTFASRVLVVAIGRASEPTLNDFLKDFRTLSSISPNAQPQQIDFRYLVQVPSHHVPDVSKLSTPAVVKDRKKLIVMLLFAVAFPYLHIPSGAYRLNCLELMAALGESFKTHCLRIISDLASYEDLHTFETKLRRSRIWQVALIRPNGDSNPVTITQDVGSDARAIRAESVHTDLLSSFGSQSVKETDEFAAAEYEEEEDSSGDDTFDPATHGEKLSDRAYKNFIKNLDDEIFQAVLKSTKAYC